MCPPAPAPAPSSQPCRYGAGCYQRNCRYQHPHGFKGPCRYGAGCRKKHNCKYTHPPDPSGHTAPEPAPMASAQATPVAQAYHTPVATAVGGTPCRYGVVSAACLRLSPPGLPEAGRCCRQKCRFHMRYLQHGRPEDKCPCATEPSQLFSLALVTDRWLVAASRYTHPSQAEHHARVAADSRRGSPH